jgi:segregation and condensation protein B
MELSRQIEALLFFKGEPVTLHFLAGALNVTEEEAREAVSTLESSLADRGIILMQNGDEYMLGTAPAMGKLIEKLVKDELSRELGKAGLETLTIVLYRGPISRTEINYIRGVNSNYILRSLLVRGLIEKVEQGGRSTVYRPTFDLLSLLGISKAEDLPGYEETAKAVEAFQAVDVKEEHEQANEQGGDDDSIEED